MRLIRITKLEGAVISLLWMFFIYFKPFYYFVEYATYSKWIFLAFVIGVVLLFVEVVETGTEARLTFFGKDTGKNWSDGIALVPNPLPFLKTKFGFTLCWGLKHSFDERLMSYNPGNKIDLFISQFIPSYRVNATASSVTSLTAHQIISNVAFWFFNVRSSIQAFGFRIVLLSVLAGVFSVVVSSNKSYNLYGRETIHETINSIIPIKKIENMLNGVRK